MQEFIAAELVPRYVSGFMTPEITVSIRSDTKALDSRTARVKHFMRGLYRGVQMHCEINSQIICF